MDRPALKPRSASARWATWILIGFVTNMSGCIERVEAPSAVTPTTQPLPAITTATGVVMLEVPGGTFAMGNDQGLPDEQPVHQVTISPLLVDKFEVTQDQYATLQLPNPARFKGARNPVEQVRWSDAALFCNERSRAEGFEPCYDELSFECNFEANGYRLPTEAEWEYIARAGQSEATPLGDSTPRALDKVACYAGSSSQQTQPAGQRRANAWGFHDLLGNVAEWCQDAYAADAYANRRSNVDPRGPDEGDRRVIRGGSWKSTADECRTTARAADNPGIADACFARDTYGFRCVRRFDPNES